VWRARRSLNFVQRDVVFGVLAGAAGILISGVILAGALYTSGEAFWAMAGFILVYHIPLMVIEGAVAGACVGFLMRVKPELLVEPSSPVAGAGQQA